MHSRAPRAVLTRMELYAYLHVIKDKRDATGPIVGGGEKNPVQSEFNSQTEGVIGLARPENQQDSAEHPDTLTAYR